MTKIFGKIIGSGLVVDNGVRIKKICDKYRIKPLFQNGTSFMKSESYKKVICSAVKQDSYDKDAPVPKSTSTEFKMASVGNFPALTIPAVNTNPNDWLVVKSDSYRPNKNKYVVDAFRKDWPNIFKDFDTVTQKDEQLSFDKISAIASRSKAINEWLSLTTTAYANEATIPNYYIEAKVIDSKVYNKAAENILKLSKMAAAKTIELDEAAKEYKEKIKKINSRYKKDEDAIKEDKIVKVLTLPSNLLPITVQLAIENYVPAQGTNVPDKHTFAREMLANYKIQLLKYIKDNPSIDVDLLIDSHAKQ